jgi:nucleoside-diphosphate-sugar epimerase
MKQRVVVLGATGFIGRRLVAALACTSWAAPVAAGHRSMLPAALFETVRLDAAHEPSLARAIESADAVVNCIAGNAATIVGTARTLFAVVSRAPRPPRVIHLSSMAVYGSAVGMVDEGAPLAGDGGAYASAKVEAERLAASCAGVVTLRPGCVYGPGSVQWSERIARWLTAHRVGDLGAAGDGTCNLVYVNDVVAAILAALRLPQAAGQAFNLGSPAPPTWNEYFLQFARALGAVPVSRISRRWLVLETKLWAPPLKVVELAARLARLRGVSVPPPIPPSLLRSWSQEIRLDVRKAQQVLGMAWTPADIGLRHTAGQLRLAGMA